MENHGEVGTVPAFPFSKTGPVRCPVSPSGAGVYFFFLFHTNNAEQQWQCFPRPSESGSASHRQVEERLRVSGYLLSVLG